MQWVLFDEGDAAPAISVAGDGAVDEARRARRGTEAMVWFRLDGKTYVSRDAELLTQLRGGHAEDRAAAARVAADVAELNARRARLAQEMAARAANRPDVDTTMLDEHKARVAQLAREMAAMRDQLHAGDTQATSEQRQRLDDARQRLDAARQDLERLRAERVGRASQMRAEVRALRAEGQQIRTHREVIRTARTAARAHAAVQLRDAVRTGRAAPVP